MSGFFFLHIRPILIDLFIVFSYEFPSENFVGKLITNGMVMQIPTKNSVGKYKDCGSDIP